MSGHMRHFPVVDPDTGCWERTGWREKNGYIRIGRNHVLAHRYYWEKQYGPIPDGMMLDHLCRNPSCCNPTHLEPVDNAENQRRGNAVRLSWDDADFIRANYKPRDTDLGTRGLARRYGVSHAAIQKVINGVSWTEKSRELAGGL